MTPEQIVRFVTEVNALDDVVRAGWVLAGVDRPESVGGHALGVLAAALTVAERVEAPVDRGRLALLALLHDLPEARVGDVPMMRKRLEDEAAEHAAMEEILTGHPSFLRDAWEEYRAQKTLEARIVKGCDKLQLMIRARAYEAEGRGDVAEFWSNERNFRDGGVAEVREVFDWLLGERRG